MKRRILLTITALLLGLASAYAQPRQLRGTVSDTNGDKLPGVSVLEKGTMNGAVTSSDGKFTINVGRNAVLEVSCLGYKTTEVTPGKGDDLFIVLEEDSSLLDEIVVVGFAT